MNPLVQEKKHQLATRLLILQRDKIRKIEEIQVESRNCQSDFKTMKFIIFHVKKVNNNTKNHKIHKILNETL